MKIFSHGRRVPLHHIISGLIPSLLVPLVGLQIKHLLILREQLVPFDIEFAGVERRLDFKSTRGALTKFFVDTRNMFRMGTDNALIHLAMESIPTVYEDEVSIMCTAWQQHPP